MLRRALVPFQRIAAHRAEADPASRPAGMAARRVGTALVVFLSLVAAAPVAARSLVIESFDVTVLVNRDGTLEVTEIIKPRFTGAWNGIYRTIPIEYRTPQGFNYTLLLRVEDVTDESGARLRYDFSRDRHYRKLKIWVPGAVDATRTVVLRYQVENGLKFFEDHDELYWNITGDEWEVPIEVASARVLLPAGAAGVRALAFTGAYGSRERDAEVEIQQNEVRFHMRRRLEFREGLTAVVGWDKGLVEEPGSVAKAGLFLRSNWPLLIPVGVFTLMFWLWYTRGRDPRLRPISAQYTPPEGLTPAEAGALVDNSANLRDITATLVDLAVRGYLLIEEKDTGHMLGLWHQKDYVFHLRKKDWQDLKPHEQKLLGAIFSGSARETVEIHELENRFYKDLPDIRARIFDALLARRYYLSRPDTVKKTYMGAGVAVIVVGFFASRIASAALGMAELTFILAAVSSGLVVLAFGYFMPARTIEGTRAFERVLGFEEFLGRVEADRMEQTIRTPQMFEKYLPFAMALGVEKNWARAFEDIYHQPPEWYRGGNYQTFRPQAFTSDLGRMSSRTAGVMASSPRSSGGSGFGGGGGGGGGFGGGGGGGF